MSRFFQRSERMAAIAHCLAGITIALEGWEHLHESQLVGTILMALGVLMFLNGVLLKRMHGSRFFHLFETGVFLIEAITFSLIAASFFHHGKKLLPWLYVALALVYLTLALVRLRKRSHPAH